MFLTNIKTTVSALFCIVTTTVGAQNFKVVLDAGHGGKDFGAVRSNYVEKKIVLDVTLKVGELLKKDKNIDVIYTRNSDYFVELRERSNIANKAKADIFVSIHANAVASGPSASGTETFVMGLSKNQSNLEVAKKENEAIILEKDYKTTYAGYNPADPSSLIGLTLLQEQYVNQSIDLAAKIQNRFTNDLNRRNRGVKQGPFWVLHGAFMPSVLVELGFLSNPEEGEYLNSEEGKDNLARAIATAILDYKRQNHSSITISDKDIKGSSEKSTPKKVIVLEDLEAQRVKENSKIANTIASNVKKAPLENEIKVQEKDIVNEESIVKGIVFKVQLAASSKETATTPSNFKGLSGVTSIKEGTLYKYYYGDSSDYNEIKEALDVAKRKGYTSAFITAYKDGKKISVQDALKNKN